jgi:hypothetical protein
VRAGRCPDRALTHDAKSLGAVIGPAGMASVTAAGSRDGRRRAARVNQSPVLSRTPQVSLSRKIAQARRGGRRRLAGSCQQPGNLRSSAALMAGGPVPVPRSVASRSESQRRSYRCNRQIHRQTYKASASTAAIQIELNNCTDRELLSVAPGAGSTLAMLDASLVNSSADCTSSQRSDNASDMFDGQASEYASRSSRLASTTAGGVRPQEAWRLIEVDRAVVSRVGVSAESGS